MSTTPIEAVKLSHKIKALPSCPQSFKAGVLSYSNAGTSAQPQLSKNCTEGLFSYNSQSLLHTSFEDLQVVSHTECRTKCKTTEDCYLSLIKY